MSEAQTTEEIKELTAGLMGFKAEVSASLAGLGGRLDAYAAGQKEELRGHERRITTSESQIEELRTTVGTHVTRDELRDALAQLVPTKPIVSGWTIASTIVQGLVGMGSLLGILILLIQVVNHT